MKLQVKQAQEEEAEFKVWTAGESLLTNKVKQLLAMSMNNNY